MNTFIKITEKLERFIRKYYLNELLRGAILFIAFGLLYLLLTLTIEYFFWLNSAGRAVLFWSFIAVEVFLLAKLVVIPLLRLLKLRKGIDYEQASEMIGSHFPEVSDKLINTLQLHKEAAGNELMQASVMQNSSALEPIPFRMAINLKKNMKYLKYAAIPVVIFFIANYAGRERVFTSSYDRVVNYNEAYVPPAPFEFFVVNEDLEAIEGKNFKVLVRTVGNVVPEEASISYDNQTYFLQQEDQGEFSYVIEQPTENVTFTLMANKVSSKPYTLEVLKIPVVTDFEMQLNYPNYTGKRNEQVTNTGNAIVPEGTTITWAVATKETKEVALVLRDTLQRFIDKERGNFEFKKRFYNTTGYEISTSNDDLKDYENIAYTIQVIKDQYPKIEVQAKTDTVNQQQTYFYGTVSDDYGLSSLRTVYYRAGTDEKQYKSIDISNGNVDQFIFTFPDDLELEQGVSYEYYFEVFDNDAIHNRKSTKSGLFSFLKLTESALEQQQLEQQSENIQDLNKSLETMKMQERELETLSRKQKEKSKLSFNDERKLDNFLKRQKQQEQLMKEYSKELKENLEEFQKDKKEESDEYKEMLKERLERQEKEAKKNEKLLEELERLREKMSKEELAEKLEKLSKQNKNSKKNLEQLVELTKRYYVQKKAEKVAEDLQKLAETQEALSEKSDEENTKEEQDKLNKEFDELKKELEELSKENDKLKKPMKIPSDKQKEDEIDQDQKEASEELDEEEQKSKESGSKQDKSGAKKKQKQAAQKMKQMSSQMQSSMQGGGQQQMKEDAEMLRQILENLLVFSFEEEELMDTFREMDNRSPVYASKLRYQNVLKQNFKHVDDSLYAMSLRNPKIEESVNESLTDINYNLDKALERFAENQTVQGVGAQQYVITGANELADFLSNALESMQNSMSGSGQGEGEGQGMQLPDILKSQEELNKEAQEGQGKKPGQKPGEGESGQSGEKPGGEQGGEQGEQGSSGQSGKQGENGESGGEGSLGEGEDGNGESGEGKSGDGTSGNGEGDGKDGEGKSGKGKNGEGENGADPNDEYDSELLYEIYKKQQDLRNKLEDAIQREGLGSDAEKLAREMEGVEQQLLDRGFSNEVMERMTQLKHELLKLKEAAIEQGKEQQREATTNIKQYSNPVNTNLEKAKRYFNTEEILNRKRLPLKESYKKKVQSYFDETDD